MSNLRPKFFKDILGQEKIKESLSIAIHSAKVRNDALGHTLIEAQPGLGKSTISSAIANELGVDCKVVLGGNIRSFKDILSTILNMKEREVLFIDEIHRINKRMAESFYTILEDFRMDLPMETDDGSKIIETFHLPHFTVIGATTEFGSLTKPFRDRFKLKFTLNLYSEADLTEIIIVNCHKLNVNMTKGAAKMIARASRGTPRIANGILEWVRDYRIAKSLPHLSESDIEAALAMNGIGLDGSTENDRRYLNFLKKQKAPVGVSTISATLGIDIDTIEQVIEPFLLINEKITKSNKGRIAI